MHCRFSFLSLSLYRPLPSFLLLSCPRGYLLGLSEDLSFPMYEKAADNDDSRKVGGWVGGHALGLEHVHFFTHAHTHTPPFLSHICREQNSKGSKRPKARRGILIRMLGGPLLYRPRTSSAVVVSNKQQEQSLAGMSEAGGA